MTDYADDVPAVGCRFFSALNWMPYKTIGPSFFCYSTHCRGQKRWIHTFSKVICASDNVTDLTVLPFISLRAVMHYTAHYKDKVELWVEVSLYFINKVNKEVVDIDIWTKLVPKTMRT